MVISSILIDAHTVCACGESGGVRLSSLPCDFRSASLASAGEDFVDSAVLCLHVLDLHDVFQAVYGAPEVDFPHGRVAILSVLSRVHCPFAEERGISFPVVAALLCVDPRHLEDGLVLVEPFEASETAAVDHSVKYKEENTLIIRRKFASLVRTLACCAARRPPIPIPYRSKLASCPN